MTPTCARLEVARNDTDRFAVVTDVAAITEAACVLICVPTPIDERQTPNLAPLSKACGAVVAHARAGQVLVLTSTTYVGCTRDLLVHPLAARGLMAGQEVHVCFAPERIDPANTSFAMAEVPKVVGGVTEACAMAAVRFLGALTNRLHLVSSPEAAEMTKLLENTFRAVNITLANEFADVARIMSLNPIEVIDAAGTKPFGFMPFYPGARRRRALHSLRSPLSPLATPRGARISAGDLSRDAGHRHAPGPHRASGRRRC